MKLKLVERIKVVTYAYKCNKITVYGISLNNNLKKNYNKRTQKRETDRCHQILVSYRSLGYR